MRIVGKMLMFVIVLTISMLFAHGQEGRDVTLEDDAEIYDNVDYTAENEVQLKARRVLYEIVIKFKSPDKVRGREKQYQREIEAVKKLAYEYFEDMGIYVIRTEELERNPHRIMNRYKNNRFIEYVEPNYIAGVLGR